MFGRRSQHDFEDEIRSHLALEAERLRAQGMSAADAERAARRAFGNIGIAEDRFYEAQRFASAQDAYELLIDLLMTLDAARPGEELAQQAFEASERKRARTLLDLLTDSGVEPQEDAAAAIGAEPARTADLQRTLDDRTVVLEFSLGERASYAWAVTRTAVHAASPGVSTRRTPTRSGA